MIDLIILALMSGVGAYKWGWFGFFGGLLVGMILIAIAMWFEK